MMRPKCQLFRAFSVTKSPRSKVILMFWSFTHVGRSKSEGKSSPQSVL